VLFLVLYLCISLLGINKGLFLTVNKISEKMYWDYNVICVFKHIINMCSCQFSYQSFLAGHLCIWYIKFYYDSETAKQLLSFFVIKPNRCTNFANLFCHETVHVSDSSSVCHHEFIHCTLRNGICHAWKLSTNLYDVYHCWVYSE